jgi:predicted DNA-binding protein (MmcQ/YjbR family)
MNIEELRTYCLSKKESTEGFPFDSDTLVFKVCGKIFALVPLERWERGKASINLKCDPEYALELRAEHQSIYPGFHMNKTHWNTIDLFKRELSPRLIFKLIDHSYDMVIKGMPKKLRDKLYDSVVNKGDSIDIS